VTVVCAITTCGKEFVSKASLNRRFCSRSCALRGRPGKRAYERPEGFRQLQASGYVHVKTNGKWVPEHWLVMQQVLGRPLTGRERVHHRNGRRDDNRPSNLELWTLDHKDPPGVRVVDVAHCPTCTCS
jgi:hypothetical protein